MHQDGAQQPVAQMPPITRPGALEGAAIHELAKDGVNAGAHAAEQREHPRMRTRVALRLAYGPRRAKGTAQSLSNVTSVLDKDPDGSVYHRIFCAFGDTPLAAEANQRRNGMVLLWRF